MRVKARQSRVVTGSARMGTARSRLAAIVSVLVLGLSAASMPPAGAVADAPAGPAADVPTGAAADAPAGAVADVSAQAVAMPVGRVTASLPAVTDPAQCPLARPARLSCYRGLARQALPAVWGPGLAALGVAFSPARIDVFTATPAIPCLDADVPLESAVYCAQDQTIYVPKPLQADFSRFYARDLARRPAALAEQARRLGITPERLSRGGEYGAVWELAHEYGHHVQHLLGWDAWFDEAVRDAPFAEQSRLQASFELMADCLSGAFTRAANRDGSFRARPLDVWSAKATMVEIQLDLRVGVGFAPFLPTAAPVIRSSSGHGSTRQRLWSYDQGRAIADLAAAPERCAQLAQRITTAASRPTL